MAEATPIHIHEWDIMVCDDLHGNVQTAGSSSLLESYPPVAPIDNDEPKEQPTRPAEPDAATPTPHKTKTNGPGRIPQKTPGKVSPTNKKRKLDSWSPHKLSQPPTDKSSAFAVG